MCCAEQRNRNVAAIYVHDPSYVLRTSMLAKDTPATMTTVNVSGVISDRQEMSPSTKQTMVQWQGALVLNDLHQSLILSQHQTDNPATAARKTRLSFSQSRSQVGNEVMWQNIIPRQGSVADRLHYVTLLKQLSQATGERHSDINQNRPNWFCFAFTGAIVWGLHVSHGHIVTCDPCTSCKPVREQIKAADLGGHSYVIQCDRCRKKSRDDDKHGPRAPQCTRFTGRCE